MVRPTVFESFGLSNETAVLRASGVINIIQLLASMPVIFTLDLLGRRPLLLFGSVHPYILAPTSLHLLPYPYVLIPYICIPLRRLCPFICIPLHLYILYLSDEFVYFYFVDSESNP